MTPTITAMLAKVILFTGFSLSPAETQCLAANIYHEARGESVMGQAAVAYVTINRARADDKTICATINDRNQFSWVRNRHTQRIDYASPAYEQAVEIASLAQINFINNPIGNATHYHSGPRPRWALSARYVGKLHNHHFYEELNGRYQRVSQNSAGARTNPEAVKRDG